MDARTRRRFRRFHALWLLAFCSLLLPTATPLAAAPQQPPSPQATPTPLVNDGDVRSFTITGNTLYWHTIETCTPAAIGDNLESLLRIPTYDGTTRLLYEREVDTIGGGCNASSTYRSNLVADAEFVYWVQTDGRLVKLSREANLGDQPVPVLQQIFNGYPAINDPIGLAIGGDYVFVNSTLNNQSTIYRVSTKDGTINTVAALNSTARKLTVKENYVYWLRDGCAYRARLVRNGWSVTGLECGGVTAIYPEGERTFCVLGCSTTDYVFLGKGKQVIRHNNLTGDEIVVYTSPASNPAVTIEDITGNFTNIFIVEYRQNACSPQPCFPNYDQALYRSGRFNANNAGLLAFDTGFLNPVSVELRAADVLNNDSYIFWLADGNVMRLPSDAAAIVPINMRITDIEVTQTIQDLDNSVLLIENKRTFARVHVASDGDPVEGVRATLRATWDGGSAGPISATSPGGWLLKVVPNPDRDNIGQSFLFELPLEWTRQNNLRLYAAINPYELPPEPNYSDNEAQVGPLTFQPSPRLEVKFFAWGYELNNTTYYPRYQEDILQTFGWIRRVYPLASATFPGPDQGGFAPDVTHIFDADLAARVDQTAEECQKLLIKNPDGSVKTDNRNKCAGKYIRSIMRAWRTDFGDPRPYFGWTSTAAGFFTRGAAGDGVGSSPAGSMCCGANWDTDGAITDWYTGHELGHLLGRPHPGKESDDPTTEVREGCGHQTDDTAYPYDGALIGPAGGSLAGFDSGWWNLPKRVYPRTIWADMMSYCSNQWISDYTYEALFNTINSLQTAGLAGAAVAQSGDWLTVHGAILPESDTAIIHRVRRQDSVGDSPTRIPGGYSLRLYDAQNQQIADYPFTPAEDDEEGDLFIAEVVPFAAGSRALQVVRLSDGAILAEQSISAAAPTIGAVTVAGAPGPINGPIDLSWTASDPDGDQLSFDVLYSADNGQSFAPVQLSMSGTSISIDRAELGGSQQAVLRVIASDGVQSASADSAPFVLAALPPRPQIVAPADGTTVQWGSTVVLVGEAIDLQDGYLGGNDLVWRLQGGRLLGTGASISVDNLPVGANVIELAATNSAGENATTSVTIIVQDDLEPAGPTLSAAPGQIGWQVAPGAGVQTYDVQITNLGGGGLNWEASSNAPWLTLSAANGSGPATLTVSADPSGIPAGATRSATLTISASVGGTTQQVQIPISLSVGATYLSDPTLAPPGGGNRLYLPLLWR